MTLPLPADTPSVIVSIASASDYLAVEISEQFVKVSVEVARADQTVEILRSVDTGVSPVVTILPPDAGDLRLTISAEQRFARESSVVVSVREIAGPALAATQVEAALSRLGEDTSDEAMDKARVMASSAVALWRDAGDNLRSARVRASAALFSYELGDVSAAIDDATAAADLFDEAGDNAGAGYALNLAGLIRIRERNEPQARAALEQAIKNLDPFYGSRAVNPARGTLCYLELVTGRTNAAETCFLNLIETAQAAGDLARVARYENNLGGVYMRLGDAVRAAELFGRALSRPSAAAPTMQRARVLNNLGIQMRQLGRPQEALNRYGEAVEIARGLKDKDFLARVLQNMSVVYGDLGAPHQALPLLSESYELLAARDDARTVLAAMNYAGALIDADDLDKAASLLDRAATLSRNSGETPNLARAHKLMAELELARNNTDAALALSQAAIVTGQSDPAAQPTVAQAMLLKGQALVATGRPEDAVTILRHSAERWAAIDDPSGEVSARTEISWALWETGKVDEAEAEAQRAIGIAERFRAAIASPDLRSTYQSRLLAAYELLIRIRQDRGDSDGALTIAERYRAQTLLEVISRGRVEETTRAPDELIRQREAIVAEINQAQDDRLRGRSAASIAAVLARLDVVDDQIAEYDERYRAVANMAPIDVDAMRALHDEDEATLVFFIGNRSLYSWLVTAKGIEAAAPAATQQLADRARQLHGAASLRQDSRQEAVSLGAALLAPFEQSLSRARTVGIVADRALHYVPFDLLATGPGKPPLLGDTALVYLPSLSTLSAIRSGTSSAGTSVAVIADPVFGADDQRIVAANATRSGDGTPLNRLPLSRLEAESIRDVAGERTVDVFLGFDAVPDALRSDEVAGAGIVHIATHGFADDEIPARSGLALSMIDRAGAAQTGFVGLRDIYGLRLEADLVVLSACETALGQDLAGEGLLGLTRGFMYAGARRVVATLWRVEDRATAELMKVFYRELFDGTPPATALVRAKTVLRQSRRFRHPYYWAGFTLQGDWR